MTTNPQPFSPALRELERMGVNWRFINTDNGRTNALTAFWVEENEDLGVFTKKKAIANEQTNWQLVITEEWRSNLCLPFSHVDGRDWFLQDYGETTLSNVPDQAYFALEALSWGDYWSAKAKTNIICRKEGDLVQVLMTNFPVPPTQMSLDTKVFVLTPIRKSYN